MPSKFFKSKLGELPKDYKYLFVFHLSKNNLPYLKELVTTVPTLGVISIAYSEQPEVREEISKYTPVYTPVVDEIPSRIVDLCQQVPDQKVIIMEIGGYSALVADKLSNVVLSVEDTARGHERFIEHQGTLAYPVISIARTQGKKLEDKAIGSAIVESVSTMWDEARLGGLLVEKAVLVLGYGGVGEATANAFRGKAGEVIVYDTDPDAQSKALAKGYPNIDRKEALGRAGLVVGCSGHRSVSLQDVQLLKEGVVLVSGSSRQVEFPYQELSAYKTSLTTNAPLEEFEVEGKSFFIAYKGQPLNFFYDVFLGEIFDIPMALMVEGVIYGLGASLPNGLVNLPDERNAEVVRAITQEFNLEF